MQTTHNTQPQKYFHWYSLVLELPHEKPGGGWGLRGERRLQQVATANCKLQLQLPTNASGAFGPDFAPSSTVWAILMPDFRLMWRPKAAENDIRYRWLTFHYFMGYTLTEKPLGLHKKCDLRTYFSLLIFKL